MSPGPAPDRPRPTSELVEVLIALRAAMADERRAVAKLDLDSLESITSRKHHAVEELGRLMASGWKPSAEEAEALHATRIDLAASCALIGTARTAVAAVLGLEADDRYDRLARCHARTRPLRAVAY
ncbi:MAG TPA: hypothetical protein VHE35_22880 [Kofleriaceae bacterium]|nr:hypothetical protein [Kofleriaceae bacterium]